MKEFIENILQSELGDSYQEFYNASPLLSFLDFKMGAIHGNSKSRRSLGTIYAIYACAYYYAEDYYEQPVQYKQFEGYEFTKLFAFCRQQYGGEKLQNHALNSRVNGEFANKFPSEEKTLILIVNSKYALHIDYLYVNGKDISKVVILIIEEYIRILKQKDSSLITSIAELLQLEETSLKKERILNLIDEKAEARIFEIISYAILKNYYNGQSVYIGYDVEHLEQQYLTLYKTGRTNANDGGIDFVMRPLGRFYQVTEVDNYDKYTLDIDKVMHFPITFVIKTTKDKSTIQQELETYIDMKSGGMVFIKERYLNAVEEIITINELKLWLHSLDASAVDELLRDIDLYYRMELNLPIE